MMRQSGTVVFERLRVRGFGPYRGAVTATFPKGLGVLALPNERGKSTLVHALTAVLFGLPHSSDPTAFGIGRFRNWHDPSRFDGELELYVNAERFRLVRNFDNHRIALFLEEEGAWRSIAVGEHNPNARRPNPQYEAWLHEIFGHTSRPLFEATFCVVQPLPLQHQLDADVQSLLSGERGSGQIGALDALAAELRRLTRHTGALGVTARDGRKDGAIEELEAEIAALEREVAESRESVDALRTVSERLAECDLALADLAKRKSRLEAQSAIAARWLETAKRARERRDEVAQLVKGAHSVRRAEDALESVRNRLTMEFPEFDGVGESIGEALIKLNDLERAIEGLERLQREQSNVSAERDRIAAAMKRAVDWPLEGAEATSWVRTFRSAFLKASEEWAAFVAAGVRARKLRAERRERYGVFEEAAPSLLAEVADYPERRADLLRELEAAEAVVRELEASVESAVVERRTLERRYAHVLGREDALPLVEERLAAEGERRRLEKELARFQVTYRKLVAARLVALAVALCIAAIDRFTSVDVPGGGIALAALLAVLAAIGGRIPPFSGQVRGFLESKRALAALQERERQLADLGWVDQGRIADVRSDLIAYRGALDMIARQEERDALRLSAAKDKVSACRMRLEAFDERMSAVAPGAVDRAYQAWRALLEDERRTVAAAASRLSAWNVPGVDGFDWDSCEAEDPYLELFRRASSSDPTTMNEPWRTFSRSVRAVAGGAPDLIRHLQGKDLADTVSTMDLLDEAFWREIEARAAKYDGLKREILALELRLEAIERAEVPRYRRAAEEALAALDRMFSERPETDDAAPSDFGDSDLATLRERIPGPLAKALAASGGDADRARARHRAWEGLKRQAENEMATLTSTLAAWGCRSAAELGQRLAMAEARLQHTIGQLEEIAGQDPTLPSHPDADLTEVQSRAEALRDEMVDVERRMEALRSEALDLGRRKAQLEGARPINVAQAEERLGALRKERQRLKAEADALACAYTNLKAAAEAYYSDHVGRLTTASSTRFAALSGTPGRRITLSRTLEVGVIDPDGVVADVSQLSLGTQDLLYISLRLAIADLMSGGRTLPFIFDDPFVNFDSTRLAKMRASIERLATERQVLIFTHREELVSWGEAIRATVEGEGP